MNVKIIFKPVMGLFVRKITINFIKIFILFIGLYPLNSYSQFSIGAQCGSTFSNAKFERTIPIYDNLTHFVIGSYTREYNTETKAAFSIGAILETRLYDFLYFQSEINYTGHRITANDNVSLDIDGLNSGSTDISLRYIEIPFLIKIKQNYQNFVPFIYTGAGIGFLEQKNDYKHIAHFYNASDDIEKNLSFALFGIGSEYILNKNVNLFISFRYSNALKDIQKGDSYLIKPHNYDLLFGVSTKLSDY
jgi:hypothetical protein